MLIPRERFNFPQYKTSCQPASAALDLSHESPEKQRKAALHSDIAFLITGLMAFSVWPIRAGRLDWSYRITANSEAIP
jgi:hypothetical protein